MQRVILVYQKIIKDGNTQLFYNIGLHNVLRSATTVVYLELFLSDHHCMLRRGSMLK